MGKLTTLEALEALAERSSNYTAQVAQAAAGAIGEQNTLKLDKPQQLNITIPSTGWVTDNTMLDYQYRVDVSIAGITDKDRAIVVITPNSMMEANECGICPTNQTLTNKIRFWSRSVPSEAIAAVYWLDKGRSN